MSKIDRMRAATHPGRQSTRKQVIRKKVILLVELECCYAESCQAIVLDGEIR